jgi:hypothetical protein
MVGQSVVGLLDDDGERLLDRIDRAQARVAFLRAKEKALEVTQERPWLGRPTWCRSAMENQFMFGN